MSCLPSVCQKFSIKYVQKLLILELLEPKLSRGDSRKVFYAGPRIHIHIQVIQFWPYFLRIVTWAWAKKHNNIHKAQLRSMGDQLPTKLVDSPQLMCDLYPETNYYYYHYQLPPSIHCESKFYLVQICGNCSFHLFTFYALVE